MSTQENIILSGHQISLKADNLNQWSFSVGPHTYYISKKREIYFLRKFLERDEFPTKGNLRTLPQHGGYKEPPSPYLFKKAFLKAHICIINDKTCDCWSARWEFGISIIDLIKYLCYFLASSSWWVFFVVLNYGILRSIGAEDGWAVAGQRAVTTGLTGVAVSSVVMLFDQSCRDEVAKYFSKWKYLKWVVLYFVIWIGASPCLQWHRHANLSDDMFFFQYSMEIVYLTAYFVLFFITLLLIIAGIIGFLLNILSAKEQMKGA